MTTHSTRSPYSLQNPQPDDCQICAMVSYQNGEATIGTADQVNEWLFVEVPRPWGDDPWQVQTDFQDLLGVVESLAADRDRYFKTRLQAIAVDREYQKPGLVRVIYYRRPAVSFCEYVRQEHCVAVDRLADLARSLLFAPEQLGAFDTELQVETGVRDLFICTHGDYDVACGRFGAPIYRTLRQQFAGDHFAGKTLRVWQVNHFGGHQFAPTLLDFPTGRWWGHLLPESIADLLNCDRLTGEPLANLLQANYRGWSGADRLAQHLEQALWQEFGADWGNWEKAATVERWHDRWVWQKGLRPILARFKLGRRLLKAWNQQAIGATVAVRVTHKQGETKSYQAKVMQTGTVKTQKRSGGDYLEVQQYKLSIESVVEPT
jgi:hypothetical protein